ncbi:hypothetical protein GCM10027321_05810 [Massilia terrae]|uniref:Uncharacterized protein n=1 Tax=Massilia terrae TaxID=1811224 RepID=A0ABT2CSU8_9BURK|nr:hypothetical protein [Massilia terrae]MCS0657059.1 hypothetical protein [Massilia terrae]
MEKNDANRQQLLVEMMSGVQRTENGREGLLQPWRRVAAHLSPLIGESGFCALLGRARRLVAPRFGWLSTSSSAKTIDALIENLGDCYGRQSADTAHDGNAALLDTFTRLLAGLIGEALTNRLLHAAARGDGEQKNAPEHKE